MSTAPTHPPDGNNRAFSVLLYRWRWPFTIALLALAFGLMVVGFGKVERFSRQVDSLKDNASTLGAAPPKMFDVRYDLWFDPEDPGLNVYQQIEDQFVAEDFVLVAFEEPDHPLGVFSPDSLETIANR